MSAKSQEKVKVYTDGACINNGKPNSAGAYAYLLTGDNNQQLCISGDYIGSHYQNKACTSPIAEYLGIINGLEAARDFTTKEVVLCSDSQLAINHINKSYRCMAKHLKPLLNEVLNKKKYFTKISFIRVPRENEFIQKADEFAGNILKNALGK